MAKRAVMDSRVVAFCCAFTLLGAGTPGADGALPTAIAIEQHLATAEGTLPAQFRETLTVTTPVGTTTRVTVLRRGADERELYEDGPLRSEAGIVGGRVWDRNENGIVTPHGANASLDGAFGEDESTELTSVERAADGAYVLTEHDPRGYVTRRYVDATAWRVVRRELFSGDRRTSVTTYDDVRTDAGRTFAHHWRTDDLIAHSATDIRVTSYTAGPVDANEVTMPASTRTLVTFPIGTTTVTLPTQFFDYEVVVRVSIGGRGLDFLLDSGASGIVLDAGVATSLGLPMYARHVETNAGSYAASETVVPSMQIGSLTIRDVVVDVLPNTDEAHSNVKIVGLLGYDFLAQLGVRIDYAHQQVTATVPAAFVPPAAADAVPVDVRLDEHQPWVTLGVNRASSDRWVLDTGASAQVIAFAPFARAHPDALRNERGNQKLVDVEYSGVGGLVDTRWYLVELVDLSGFALQGVRVDLVTSSGSYDYGEDGLIGGELLSYFTLVFDYPHARVYLVPNH